MFGAVKDTLKGEMSETRTIVSGKEVARPPKNCLIGANTLPNGAHASENEVEC